MPIYEYQCSKCGEFEVTQRITEDPLKRCPTCRGKVKKLISNTSFQLKGTGWYVTDYGRKDSGKESNDTGGDSKSESTESAAKDTTTKETIAKDSSKKESPKKESSSKDTKGGTKKGEGAKAA